MQNQINKFRILIAGYPGIGKTTLGLSAPKPLLIDVDFGINRTMASVRKDYIQPENYEELLNDLKGDLSEYETIVIDTGGKLLELMKAYVIKMDVKNAKKDGTLSLQGYGAVGREFTRFMNYIYYELRKHCVIIFHSVEEKQDDETKLRILVEGSTKNTVWQNVELGGFIEMRGNKKTIGFDNCERYFAKSSFGIRGFYNIPELDENTPNDFLTKLFEQANKNIQEDSKIFEEERKKCSELVQKYTNIINEMTTKNVNKVVEEIKSIDKHILTSEKEIKDHFKKKIEELGLIWDKNKEKYEIKKEIQEDEQG